MLQVRNVLACKMTYNLNAIPEVSYGSCLPDFGGWCQESTEEQGTLMVGFGQPGPPFPGPVHLCAGVWIASWLVVHLRRSLVRTH